MPAALAWWLGGVLKGPLNRVLPDRMDPTMRALLLTSLRPIALALAIPPALEAMKHFAATLTTHPRSGDRAAIEALKAAGLAEEAIVALAQLVSFLAYQTRLVAGLLAMKATTAMKPGAQA